MSLTTSSRKLGDATRMSKRRSRWDVEFYAHNSKRKKPIAGSTVATNLFLVSVHEEHPDCTIAQLHSLLTDKTQYVLEPEAVAVLDAYIKAGEGGVIPKWK